MSPNHLAFNVLIERLLQRGEETAALCWRGGSCGTGTGASTRGRGISARDAACAAKEQEAHCDRPRMTHNSITHNRITHNSTGNLSPLADIPAQAPRIVRLACDERTIGNP